MKTAIYLCDPLCALLTKLSWVAEVLDQVRQQTQHIQRETCTERQTFTTIQHGWNLQALPDWAKKSLWEESSNDTQHLPTDCEASTTGTRETGVSWQKSCNVRSEVVGEVKPFNRSCWIPENPLHLSWACSFSRRSRFSALSKGTWGIGVFWFHWSWLQFVGFTLITTDFIKSKLTILQNADSCFCPSHTFKC